VLRALDTFPVSYSAAAAPATKILSRYAVCTWSAAVAAGGTIHENVGDAPIPSAGLLWKSHLNRNCTGFAQIARLGPKL
jgi:hypothetical protein